MTRAEREQNLRRAMEDAETEDPDNLRAGAEMYDQLLDGSFYRRQEKAARSLGLTVRYIG